MTCLRQPPDLVGVSEPSKNITNKILIYKRVCLFCCFRSERGHLLTSTFWLRSPPKYLSDTPYVLSRSPARYSPDTRQIRPDTSQIRRTYLPSATQMRPKYVPNRPQIPSLSPHTPPQYSQIPHRHTCVHVLAESLPQTHPR